MIVRSVKEPWEVWSVAVDPEKWEQRTLILEMSSCELHTIPQLLGSARQLLGLVAGKVLLVMLVVCLAELFGTEAERIFGTLVRG